jgi:hypothetical protein
MSFLQREYDKLQILCTTMPDGKGYDAVYLAKQVLAWVLDPDAVSSPSAYLTKFYGVSLDGTKGTGITFEADKQPGSGTGGIELNG